MKSQDEIGTEDQSSDKKGQRGERTKKVRIQKPNMAARSEVIYREPGPDDLTSESVGRTLILRQGLSNPRSQAHESEGVGGRVDGPRSDVESEVVKMQEEGFGVRSQTGVRGHSKAPEVGGWRRSEVEGQQSCLKEILEGKG